MAYRRRFGRRSWRTRLGVTGLVGISALALIFLIGLILDLRRGGGNEAALVEYVRAAGVPPVELLVDAASTRRIVFLADIHPTPEPKRLAAQAIDALVRGPGLDAVVVEVGADLQPLLDQYLATSPENVGILMAEPRVTREHRGAGASLLPLYRAVWRINDELPPARSIRVIAADLPEWAGRGAMRPRDVASLFAQRAAYMADRVDAEVLLLHPGSRILVFMDGYQTLRAGEGEFRAGGTRIVNAQWLAAELERRYPRDVFSMLVDGGSLQPAPEEIAYRGTAAGAILRTERVRGPRAVPVTEAFDFLRPAIDMRTGPGVELDITPRGYHLREVTHAYAYLGN